MDIFCNDEIEVFPENYHGRDFVCGDIHGMYYDLLEVLDDVNFDETVDRLFCTGDLIDRGPNSPACMRLLDQPWFNSVFGNHEWLARCHLEKPAGEPMWIFNGGGWFDDSEDSVKFMQEYLDKLPLAIKIDRQFGSVGIIHADVPEVDGVRDWNNLLRLNNDKRLEAIWSRRMTIKEPIRNIDSVYVGHNVVPKSYRSYNKYYIDTGSCFTNGYITLVEV